MVGELARIARDSGEVPLCWAGAAGPGEPLNLGDALSPVMVALMSGKPVRRVPFRSETPRLVAVGTVGQNVSKGAAWFWGTGCGARCDDDGRGRTRYSPDPEMRAHVCATRGPMSAIRLGGGRLATRVFGDPVWLLPRFYAPQVEKRWDLGVILHLSELVEQTEACRPRPELRRFEIPEEFAGSVRLIGTVTGERPADLKARLDEILSCRRILSTSLHGLVYAESYGIPCLYFPTSSFRGGERGAGRETLTAESRIDHRMLDLYLGVGRSHIDFFSQPAGEGTDWEAAMAAIDAAWEPVAPDLEPLVSAFPLDLSPVRARPGETVWEHPVIAGLDLTQGGPSIRAADRAAAQEAARNARKSDRIWARKLSSWGAPATSRAAPPPPPSLRLKRRAKASAVVPMVWAEDRLSPWVNLGDALSPVIVAALTGLPVERIPSKSGKERLAAVGTIAQSLRSGRAHLWGCGMDASLNLVEPGRPYAPPPDTHLHVHALRGPRTAETFRRLGVEAPEVFGDPVYFVDRIFNLERVEKRYDLGVIVHLSELEPPPAHLRTEFSRVVRDRLSDVGLTRMLRLPPSKVIGEYRRYLVPEAFSKRVKIITMNVERSYAAVRARLREIASCRAILSTSLHGLVLADVYGVPNAWFGFGGGGFAWVDPLSQPDALDHRMSDLYAGQRRARVPVVRTHREEASDWGQLIEWSRDFEAHSPDCRPLFEAFPGPRAARWGDARWPTPSGLVAGFR